MSMHKLAHFFLRTRTIGNAASYRKLFKRGCTQQTVDKNGKFKEKHPYKRLRPWRSLTEFSAYLVENMIYNRDGLVALNKPYGVPSKSLSHPEYSLHDALPYIAKKLNYSKLFVIKNPEKYMTGVTLLAADSQVQETVRTSLCRGNNFTKTYWVVTTMPPKQSNGRDRLGMIMESDCRQTDKPRKAVLITSWSHNSQKRSKVKVMNFEYKVLSSSTSSYLLQIRASSNKQHAVRLYATTFLYAPVLGDWSIGPRIQRVGNTCITVNPHSDFTNLQPPVLDKNIYRSLNIQSNQQYFVPIHIHLRSISLPSFLKKGEDLKIEAPLMPPIDWTCTQLQLKYSSTCT